jgi:hypothetical protein
MKLKEDTTLNKLLAVILLLSLILTLTACGTSSVSTDEPSANTPEEIFEEPSAADTAAVPEAFIRTEIAEPAYTLAGVINAQIYVTASVAEITLDNAEITCTGGTALLAADGNQSITLNLVGNNYITSAAADAIVGGETFTITGDGTLSVKADNPDGKAITVLGTLTFDHSGGECRFESITNEAIEAEKIFLSSGSVIAVGGEDGVNASSDRSDELTTCEVNISGGRLRVYSKSDGIDSNGTITITGGDVAVFINAPTDGDPLDADGAVTITAGIFCFESISANGGKLKIVGSDGSYIWIDDDVPGGATSFFITSLDFIDGAEYTVISGDTELSPVTAGTENLLPRQTGTVPDGARPNGGGGNRGGNIQIIPDPSTGGNIVVSPGGVTEVAPGETVPRQPGGNNSGAPGARPR